MASPSVADRVKAATWFAERGFGVFTVWSTTPDGVCRCPQGRACPTPGKHPIPRKGFKDNTTDPVQIAKILAAGSSPNYGLVPPEGVFALDVDGDDIRRLADLEERLGPLPPTLRTETANGVHIFLRWPDGMPRPQGKLFGFVTRFGDTGYVIGPRSVHATGVEYRPAGPLEIADIPPNWMSPPRANGPATITIGGGLPGVGGRHDWLRDRARYYRGVGMDRPVLRAALMAENARLDTPKTEDEVDRAIGNVFEKFEPDAPDEVEAKVSRRLGEDDRLGPLPQGNLEPFPEPPDAVVYGGLVGEMVEALASGTDAALEGLLASLLPVLGAVLPVAAHWHRYQTSSPYMALIGESGVGRKSTAMFTALDGVSNAIGRSSVAGMLLSGINSGEAIVTSLLHKKEGGQKVVALVLEEEFARMIASRSREGSTLDAVLRQAFDGGPLANRRSDSVRIVPSPYWLPALVAITPAELQRKITTTDIRSGSGNRWLYTCVRRRDVFADGRDPVLPQELTRALISAKARIDDSSSTPLLTVDPEVVNVLTEYSQWLYEIGGVAQDMTQRMPVHAFRTALVHAAAERSHSITIDHIRRGIELAEYGRRGLPWAFGSALLGNEDTRLVYRHLVLEGRLRTRTIEREMVRDPIRRQNAIDDLVERKLAFVEVTKPGSGTAGGRPTRELVPTGLSLVGVLSVFTGIYIPRGEEGSDKTDKTPIRAQTGVTQPVTEPDITLTQRDTTPTETIACSNYAEHQTQHLFHHGMWICPVCSPWAVVH